jgi:hypothetical protein
MQGWCDTVRQKHYHILNPHYNGHIYDGQNLAVYSYESVKMLRHWEGLVLRKLFKIKKKKKLHVIALYVSMFMAFIGCASYVVLPWLPLHSVTVDTSENGHPVPPVGPLKWGFTVHQKPDSQKALGALIGRNVSLRWLLTLPLRIKYPRYSPL